MKAFSSPVLVTGDEDRLTADEGSEIVVRVGDLALVGQIDPVALEDVPHLQLEQLGIGEDVAADPIDASLRVVLQRGVDGGLDVVQHVSLLAWFILRSVARCGDRRL